MIDLTEETKKKLELAVAKYGYRDGDTAIADALNQLEKSREVSEKADLDSDILPYNKWVEEFRSWIETHKLSVPNVDTSRESIYSDRGACES